MKNLIIINAGKFGREVLSWAIDTIRHGEQWRVKGFLDDRQNELDGFACGAPILGSASTYQPEYDDVFLAAIGEPAQKYRYCQPLLKKGASFTNLIHPLACVGPRVELGQGVIIPPFCNLTCDMRIGSFVTLGVFSGIGHDVQVGDWSQINGHCSINGNALLEEGVFLGAHSCILPGACVGSWAYVGAGSVVLRRVKPRTKVFGNPAQKIGDVEDMPAK